MKVEKKMADTFNRVQKIALLALIAIGAPVLALNVITPRLSIATGGLEMNLVDLTVCNFTSVSGYPAVGYNETITDVGTLDFWLEVGLPIKNDSNPDQGEEDDSKWKVGGIDPRYYLAGGAVNIANLVDPTQQVIIPQIGVTANFQGIYLGKGGSVRQYVLNAEHPVEYVHLYLTGSRMPNDGLMYMFNFLAATGVLDDVLLSALGVSEEEVGFEALLSDLKLDLTAYLGGAPVTLPLDFAMFGLSPFPCVDIGPASISPSVFEKNGPPEIYYNYSVNNDSMSRFLGQLGLDNIEGIFALLGVTTADLTNMLNQMFTDQPIRFDAPLSEPYWNATNNYTTGLIYSATEMKALLTTEISQFKARYDGSSNLINMTYVSDNIDNRTLIYNHLYYMATHVVPLRTTELANEITSNSTSWYRRLYYLSIDHLVLYRKAFDFCTFDTDPTPTPWVVFNTARGENVAIIYDASIANLFAIMNLDGYGLDDIFIGLGKDIPVLLTSLLFRTGMPLTGQEAPSTTLQDFTSIAPVMGGIEAKNVLLFTIIAAFIVLFLIFAITKGSVKINRSDFLGREAVARNVKDFISRVDQLGGKVSVQNAESLAIRAFRTDGKIDKPADVEKRAKTYVENQKLLVTLQSRASRAYVAQKFKDCIGAIEKMIQIARKLEDQTLVQNYEENLAKVVRLLRRKGISVSTKVRVEEGAKPGEEVEQLGIYKKELIDLQNRASKAFAEKNFADAKESIKQMLAIAKKIQDPVLIRNYEANLRKIIAMEKGGSA
jgi:hypothetical protein